MSTRYSFRRWRLQYSLRFVFITFAACAIAVPIWYRWPYQQVVEQKSAKGEVLSRRVGTWQRQWGGPRLLHGPMTTWAKGDFVIAMNYANGLPHGPYRETYKGEPWVIGQYVHGKKEGIWTHHVNEPIRFAKRRPGTHHTSASTHQATWRDGRLDGPYTGRSTSGIVFQFDFVKGQLKAPDGQLVRNRLFDLLEAGELNTAIVPGSAGMSFAEALRQDTSIEIVETPLQDVVLFLQEAEQVPIILDTARVSPPDLPITANYRGMELCSALMLLTSSYDLDCDFRYGMLWITTVEDAKNWHDPTGGAKISPAKDTLLWRAWNEPASLEAINQPIGTLLTRISQPLAIEIDRSQLSPIANQPLVTRPMPAPPPILNRPTSATPPAANLNSLTITADLKGFPFRHILGFALYKTSCRCKLEGDKLVILPPAPGS